MESGRLDKKIMNSVLLQTVHSRYGNKKSKNFRFYTGFNYKMDDRK